MANVTSAEDKADETTYKAYPVVAIEPALAGFNEREEISELSFEEGSVCKSIAFGTFADCTGLTKVTFPDSMTTIGEEAFARCEALGTTEATDPYVLSLNKVTNVSKGAFVDCTGLTDLNCANGETIGEKAFNGCTGLVNVTCGSVKTIDADAFSGCTSLENVTFDSVQTIGSGAFSGCTSLANIDLGNVVTISENAFKGDALDSFTIPASCTTIEAGAFADQDSFNIITVADGCVATVADGAFDFAFKNYNDEGYVTVNSPVMSLAGNYKLTDAANYGDTTHTKRTRAFYKTYKVQGLVTDKMYNALKGATVENDGTFKTTTDDEGMYTLDDVLCGTTALKVSADGYYMREPGSGYDDCYIAGGGLDDGLAADILYEKEGRTYGDADFRMLSDNQTQLTYDGFEYLYNSDSSSLTLLEPSNDRSSEAYANVVVPARVSSDGLEGGVSTIYMQELTYDTTTKSYVRVPITLSELTELTVWDYVSYIYKGVFANCDKLARITFPGSQTITIEQDAFPHKFFDYDGSAYTQQMPNGDSSGSCESTVDKGTYILCSPTEGEATSYYKLYSISGKITDAYREVVDGATLSVDNLTGTEAITTTTNSNGEYVFDEAVCGVKTLSVNATTDSRKGYSTRKINLTDTDSKTAGLHEDITRQNALQLLRDTESLFTVYNTDGSVLFDCVENSATEATDNYQILGGTILNYETAAQKTDDVVTIPAQLKGKVTRTENAARTVGGDITVNNTYIYGNAFYGFNTATQASTGEAISLDKVTFEPGCVGQTLVNANAFPLRFKNYALNGESYAYGNVNSDSELVSVAGVFKYANVLENDTEALYKTYELDGVIKTDLDEAISSLYPGATIDVVYTASDAKGGTITYKATAKQDDEGNDSYHLVGTGKAGETSIEGEEAYSGLSGDVTLAVHDGNGNTLYYVADPLEASPQINDVASDHTKTGEGEAAVDNRDVFHMTTRILVDGIWYTVDPASNDFGTGTQLDADTVGKQTDYVIQDSVKSLYDGKDVPITTFDTTLFQNNEAAKNALKNITIGANIEKLVTGTFSSMPKLETVTFVDGNKCSEIEASSFDNCAALKSVALGNDNSISSIGENAFINATSLLTVNFGNNSAVETVSKSAFQGATSLQTINFGNNSALTTIAESAFEGAAKLADIEFGTGSKLATIETKAFYGAESIKEISLPASLQDVKESAFEGATSLETLSVADNSSLQKVWASAFAGAESLKTLSFGNNSALATVGESAFEGVKSLTSLNFGTNSKLQTIEKNAFNGIESLQELNLPTALETIGESAFEGGKAVKAIVIPASVKTIGKAAFKDFTKAETLEFATGVTALSGNANVSSLTLIDESGFENLASVKMIKLPSEIEEIGVSSFKGATSLLKVVLPDSLETVGDTAFEDCDELDTLQIDTNCKAAMGKNVFPFKTYTYESSYKEVNNNAKATAGKYMVRTRDGVQVLDQVFDLSGTVTFDGVALKGIRVTIDDGRDSNPSAAVISTVSSEGAELADTEAYFEKDASGKDVTRYSRPSIVTSDTDGSFIFHDEFCGNTGHVIALDLNGGYQANDGAFGPIVGDTVANVELATIPAPEPEPESGDAVSDTARTTQLALLIGLSSLVVLLGAAGSVVYRRRRRKF